VLFYSKSSGKIYGMEAIAIPHRRSGRIEHIWTEIRSLSLGKDGAYSIEFLQTKPLPAGPAPKGTYPPGPTPLGTPPPGPTTLGTLPPAEYAPPSGPDPFADPLGPAPSLDPPPPGVFPSTKPK
jgi:hypothetical protein